MYYQPETGSFWNEDVNGYLHSFVQNEDNSWNYELYDTDDKIVISKKVQKFYMVAVKYSSPYAIHID